MSFSLSFFICSLNSVFSSKKSKHFTYRIIDTQKPFCVLLSRCLPCQVYTITLPTCQQYCSAHILYSPIPNVVNTFRGSRAKCFNKFRAMHFINSINRLIIVMKVNSTYLGCYSINEQFITFIYKGS